VLSGASGAVSSSCRATLPKAKVQCAYLQYYAVLQKSQWRGSLKMQARPPGSLPHIKAATKPIKFPAMWTTKAWEKLLCFSW
jgi:hypothetical protein